MKAPDVPCPKCNVPAGEHCKAPSGGRYVGDPHVDRVKTQIVSSRRREPSGAPAGPSAATSTATGGPLTTTDLTAPH